MAGLTSWGAGGQTLSGYLAASSFSHQPVPLCQVFCVSKAIWYSIYIILHYLDYVQITVCAAPESQGGGWSGGRVIRHARPWNQELRLECRLRSVVNVRKSLCFRFLLGEKRFQWDKPDKIKVTTIIQSTYYSWSLFCLPSMKDYWEESKVTPVNNPLYSFVWRTSWENRVLVLGKQSHKNTRSWDCAGVTVFLSRPVCCGGVLRAFSGDCRDTAIPMPCRILSSDPRHLNCSLPPLRRSGCSQKSTDLCGSGYFGRRPWLFHSLFLSSHVH